MHRFEDLIGSNLISLFGGESSDLRLLVALSGGADSVALLRAMAAGAKKGMQIFVCHVNHGLRGQDADNDQAFCQNLCSDLKLPLQVIKLDLKKEKSSEDALRALRYQALVAVAEELSISHVVTAHTLSDQVETMLFRMCRGTSLSGLVGMKALRPITKEISLVRPMLGLNRHDIEAYLSDISQSWCSDKSNSDGKFSRNFLRNNIVPQLSERFSALSQNIEQLRQNIEQENNLLELLAGEKLESLRQPGLPQSITLSEWSLLHPALQARVLVLLMRESGVEASFERVQRVMRLIRNAKKREVRSLRNSLGSGIDIVFDGDCLQLAPHLANAGQQELDFCRQSMLPISVQLPGPGKSSRLTVIPWLDKALQVEALEPPQVETIPPRQALFCLVDLRGINGPLTFRPRQEGDRIHPLGMQQSVRLKQYLHANKAICSETLLKQPDPVLALRLTPVLADQEEVLWVPGYGLSQKVKVGQHASHCLSFIDLASDLAKIEVG